MEQEKLVAAACVKLLPIMLAIRRLVSWERDMGNAKSPSAFFCISVSQLRCFGVSSLGFCVTELSPTLC